MGNRELSAANSRLPKVQMTRRRRDVAGVKVFPLKRQLHSLIIRNNLAQSIIGEKNVNKKSSNRLYNCGLVKAVNSTCCPSNPPYPMQGGVVLLSMVNGFSADDSLYSTLPSTRLPTHSPARQPARLPNRPLADPPARPHARKNRHTDRDNLLLF